MLKKLFILLFLTATTVYTKAQNIHTALHLNGKKEYETKKPYIVNEENIFYGRNGKKVNKNVKQFDPAGMLLVEERYDEDNNLTEKLTYTNDTINKIKLSRTFEKWTRFGYSIQTAHYNYNDKYQLIEIIDKDGNGRVYNISKYTVNDEGYPIEVSVFNGNGNLFGKEVAKYLYDENKVITTVFANDGRELTTNANFYDFGLNRDNSNTAVNPADANNFKYDEFGNCTEEKVYKVDSKGKRKLNSVFKKQYIYK